MFLGLLFKIQTQRSQESQFVYWEINKVYPLVFIEIVAEIQKILNYLFKFILVSYYLKLKFRLVICFKVEIALPKTGKHSGVAPMLKK